MPPKKKGGKKKKKNDEPKVARPEPMDCDETEAAYLWDRIHPIKPNPLGPVPFLYNYTTTQVMDAGPAPAVVSGMASATVPLLHPHPPSAPSAPSSARKAGSSGGGGGGSGQPLPPPVPNAGDLHVPLSPWQAPDPADPQARPVGPQPPSRQRAMEEKRATVRVAVSANAWQESLRELKDVSSDRSEVTAAINQEHEELDDLRRDLGSRKRNDEDNLRATQLEQNQKLEEQRQQTAIVRIRLEEQQQKLLSYRARVEADLADKNYTLAELAKQQKALDSLKLNHQVILDKEKARLDREVYAMKETMVSRLRATMEEMEDLTQRHREKRQQRAVSESARLVAKLSSLEQRSKQLTTANSKLTAKAESTKRDQQLEAERHSLLAKKSQTLSKEIRELSGQLQNYEKQFAEKTSAASHSEQVVELSQTIDRQYQVILKLKNELDTVKEETAEAKRKLAAVEQRQFLALRAAKSASGTSLVASGDGVLTVTADDKQRVKSLIVKAVVDIDKTMKEMSTGTRSIGDVKSATEQAELLKYILTRVQNHQSGVFPVPPAISENADDDTSSKDREGAANHTPTNRSQGDKRIQVVKQLTLNTRPIPPPPLGTS